MNESIDTLATGVAAVVTSLHVTLAAAAAQTIMVQTVWSNLTNAFAFLAAARLIAVFVVSTSDWGRAVVRWLA